MHTTIKSQIIQVVVLFAVGLGCTYTTPGAGWNMTAYRKAIQSGRKILTEAAEMESQFANTEHMIIMYGEIGSLEHEWQTVSFFGGRYELTMSVNVVLSSNGDSVSTNDTGPKFFLTACKKINATGGASMDSSRQLEFDVAKWREFKASGFDILLLDPKYDGSALPDFEEYANDWQQSRRVWR
jgi:hypothetical protein